MQILGYKADLSYNIALCNYMMHQYAPALKHIADIIEKGIREHPGKTYHHTLSQQGIWPSFVKITNFWHPAYHNSPYVFSGVK